MKLKKYESLQTKSDMQDIAGWVLMQKTDKTDFKINYLEKVKQLIHIIHWSGLIQKHPPGRLH